MSVGPSGKSRASAGGHRRVDTGKAVISSLVCWTSIGSSAIGSVISHRCSALSELPELDPLCEIQGIPHRGSIGGRLGDV